MVAFLTGDFDDSRCSDLLAGMVWAQPAQLSATMAGPDPRPVAVPFPYSALKPIFSTDEGLIRVGSIRQEGTIPIPPGLIGLLRAGSGSLDGRVTHRAVCGAFARARSSGLPSPYDPARSASGPSASKSGRIGVGIRPDRLAAAMLIPISDHGLSSLLRRAYPGAVPEPAIYTSKETWNVH